MRIFRWVMVPLFALCVAVQYNDPDPVRWMAIYGAALVACVLPLSRGARGFTILVGAVALVWALTIAPRVWGRVTVPQLFQSMDPKQPQIEEGREMGGLLIVAATMAVLLGRRR